MIAAAYPARFDAADVPRLLATTLAGKLNDRRCRLVEVHALSLPYWRDAAGRLTAAYPSAMDAVERLDAPTAATVATMLQTLPPLASPPTAGAATLVLLPAFDVVYEVCGRRFHAIVDAHRGTVHGDLWPYPWRVDVHLAMAGVLAVDTAIFSVVASLVPDPLWRVAVVTLVAVPIYFLNQRLAVRLGDRWRS